MTTVKDGTTGKMMTMMNELKKYNPNIYVLDLDEYQDIATGTAVYPGQDTPIGLIYTALKMNGEAGEFAEHVGKAMRDDRFGTKFQVSSAGFIEEITVELTSERRSLLIKEIGDVLWYLSAACNELGISLSQAANENLKKLYDRKHRGVLSGSGDTR